MKSTFGKEDEVLILGLKNALHLNKRVGFIEKKLENGRYNVEFRFDNTITDLKSVSEMNLHSVDELKTKDMEGGVIIFTENYFLLCLFFDLNLIFIFQLINLVV